MKLIYCKFCLDVVSLRSYPRSCACGSSGGNYLEDGLNAVIWGSDCVPLGILNNSFVEAVVNRPEGGLGQEFTAFVIPKHSLTVTLLDLTDEQKAEKEAMNIDKTGTFDVHFKGGHRKYNVVSEVIKSRGGYWVGYRGKGHNISCFALPDTPENRVIIGDLRSHGVTIPRTKKIDVPEK